MGTGSGCIEQGNENRVSIRGHSGVVVTVGTIKISFNITEREVDK